MPRTIGAKNKPKYIGVQLSELNRVFSPAAVISVASFYDGIVNKVIEFNDNPPQNEKKIRISRIE